MIIAGVSEPAGLVEIIEIEDHPWFVGCQFHPEFKSRPQTPHPLFSHFIQAAIGYSRRREWSQQKEEKNLELKSPPTPVKAQKSNS